MNYPRLQALGPIVRGEPYHPIRNPLIFNLVWPGNALNGSSISLMTFKNLKRGIES